VIALKFIACGLVVVAILCIFLAIEEGVRAAYDDLKDD
jgi:hypothetical protein